MSTDSTPLHQMQAHRFLLLNPGEPTAYKNCCSPFPSFPTSSHHQPPNTSSLHHTPHSHRYVTHLPFATSLPNTPRYQPTQQLGELAMSLTTQCSSLHDRGEVAEHAVSLTQTSDPPTLAGHGDFARSFPTQFLPLASNIRV